ncbi:MAG TPA: SpoIID/LytB domain-containing protein, partial [Candidatus Methylomirabilis sp.]|nr:SpoIID/LytB domain-containing protein [Candidatus Methylomirabilis sp.]
MAPALASDEIRVAIAGPARTLEVGGGPMDLRDASGRRLAEYRPTWLRAVATSAGIELRSSHGGRVWILRAARLRLAPGEGGALRINGRDYPGAVEIAGEPGGLTAINELPLEEYLVGAVKAEAGDQMPLEMLKAQAIVARTYAAYQRQL